MITHQEILEALRIKNKDFNKVLNKTDKINQIKWNNSISHNLFDKIKDRSHLSYSEVISKIKSALDSKIDDLKSDTYCFYFDVSKFILVFNYNKEKNSVLIVTILSYEMKTNDCVKMSLDEVQEIDYKPFLDKMRTEGFSLINEKIFIEPEEENYLFMFPLVVDESIEQADKDFKRIYHKRKELFDGLKDS